MSDPIGSYNKITKELLDAWKADMAREQELRERIAELEAEVELQSKSADHWEEEAIQHMNRAGELEAENNAYEKRENAYIAQIDAWEKAADALIKSDDSLNSVTAYVDRSKLEALAALLLEQELRGALLKEKGDG